MSRTDKLIERIRNNPRDVRLDDAMKIAERLGFKFKSRKGTSHHAFSRPGEPVGLNFQDIGAGKIPKYQADQLIAMIDRYGDELE